MDLDKPTQIWRIPARRIPRRPDEIGAPIKANVDSNTPKEQIIEVIKTGDDLVFPEPSGNAENSPKVNRRKSYDNRRRESVGSEHDGLKQRYGLVK